jgi:hypothetical protein
MGIKEVAHSDSFFSKGKVRRSYKCNLSSSFDEKNVKIFVAGTTITNNSIMRQQFNYHVIKESCVSQENQAH